MLGGEVYVAVPAGEAHEKPFQALAPVAPAPYVAGEFDFPADSLRLPWPDDAAARWVVGELARKRGSENPSRLVASAKSWLSYAGASRMSPILPWGAPEEVPKLSPVAASARYLQHLRQAWDARFAAGQPHCR